MSNTITFKDKCLCLNMRDMVDALDEGARLELAHFLACDDVIIKDVADQILCGYTDDGSYGAKNMTGGIPTTPLSMAQRRVAKESGDVAKREIEQLERAVSFAEKVKDEYMEKYFILYHAWPKDYKMPDAGKP